MPEPGRPPLATHAPTPIQVVEALISIAQNGIPAPGAAWITDVGTEGFLRYFDEEVMAGLIGAGCSTCRFFEAVYGAGKTHLLDLIGSMARSRGFAVVKTDLSKAVTLSDWKLITIHTLENITLFGDCGSIRSLPRILHTFGQLGRLNPDTLRGTRLPHVGFSTAMLLAAEDRFPSAEARGLVHRYLMGERIGVGQFQRCGVRGVVEPLSERNAEQVLSTVSSGLVALGLPGVILLFDENEQSFLTHGEHIPRKIQTSANLIRRLIDACVMGELRGVLAVFAVLPGFLGRCARAYPALAQRIERPDRGQDPAAWRWPVLDVPDLTREASEEEFAERAVSRMHELARADGDAHSALRVEMLREARRVLEEHVGSGFRRPMMKTLAHMALQEMKK